MAKRKRSAPPGGAGTLDPKLLRQRLRLSERQAETLAWMIMGKTNPEIAAIIGASPATVAKHAQAIFLKLRVASRTAAAVRAIEILHGLHQDS